MTNQLFTEIECLREVDSTNEYLKQFVDSHRPRAVRADRQTAGKGRHGRSWYSPAREGLYISYLLFPPWKAEHAVILNQVSALAVGRTLLDLESSLAGRLQFKPPNDVLVEGRKISGILVEMSTLGNQIRWAIVGIGLNLNQREFSGQTFRLTPTSLILEGKAKRSAAEVCGILTRHLENFYQAMERGDTAQIDRIFGDVFQEPFLAAGEE